ncbi:MAG TPA: hypothetical protein VF571_10685 [Pyrinomonadaceae bacterium]
MKSKILLFLFCFLSLTLNNFAQENQFPNEIEGYQFFKDGRLRGLKLLVSTKNDVKAVMGENCQNGCDYDQDWEINFSYVGSNWYKKITENGVERIYKPKPELIGTLQSVSFRPKRQILLSESIVFPKEFECLNGETTSGKIKYNSRICMDKERLIYNISNQSTADGKVFRGQLMSVSYISPKKDDDGIFALIEK